MVKRIAKLASGTVFLCPVSGYIRVSECIGEGLYPIAPKLNIMRDYELK